MSGTDYKLLLPSYLQNQAWLDLADAMSAVFDTEVHQPLDALEFLRHTSITDYDLTGASSLDFSLVADKVANREFILPTDYHVFDSNIERLRLNHLGVRIENPSILDPSLLSIVPTLANSPLHRTTQTIGMYWYHKGLGEVIEYINFVLNTNVRMSRLWTTDYVTFLQEDEGIGVPIWDGGPWYPTTHVRINIVLGEFDLNTLPELVRLFYAIANYNLVLESVALKIMSELTYDVTDTGPVGLVPDPLAVVSTAMVVERTERVISPYYAGPPYI
jgi:hypothetical protein